MDIASDLQPQEIVCLVFQDIHHLKLLICIHGTLNLEFPALPTGYIMNTRNL